MFRPYGPYHYGANAKMRENPYGRPLSNPPDSSPDNIQLNRIILKSKRVPGNLQAPREKPWERGWGRPNQSIEYPLSSG